MKASELAAKLMENPDLEVYYEEYNSPDFSDGFYWTSGVDGVQITPDGVFITTNCLRCDFDNLKTPSTIPRIDTVTIHIKDGLVPFNFFPLDSERGDDAGKYMFQEFLDYDVIYGHSDGVSYHLSEKLETKEENYSTHNINTSDVEKVTVLTSYDPVTWEPSYTDYTWDEVKEYFIKKYNIEKIVDNYNYDNDIGMELDGEAE